MDLSYYDGPPLIAYLIKLNTLLFGSNLFSLNLVAILITGITAWIIYLIGKFFLDQKLSTISACLWLFSPLVTLGLLKQVSYDNPLNLFWALTIYFVFNFIKFQKIKDLYLIGVSCGLLLLAKYSGIVLILGILIFIVTSRFRNLLKEKHFYGAIVIATLIFCPVIIWNYNHNWQSFIYQLSSHDIKNNVFSGQNILKSFFYIFIPALNFILFAPLLCITKNNKLSRKNSDYINLLIVTSFVFLIFYLFIAGKANLRTFWLEPFLISGCLLLVYYFKNNIKIIRILAGVYFFISFLILLNSNYLFTFFSLQKKMNYVLLQRFNQNFPNISIPVVTPGWFEARSLFFLKNHPKVYTFPCGSPENQYAYWSQDIQRKIRQRQINEIIFIDPHNRINCIKPYFSTCFRLNTSNVYAENQIYSLYAYKCFNLPEINETNKS